MSNLQQIIIAEKEEFREIFGLLLSKLEEEYGEGNIYTLNNKLRSHIDSHTKNIIEGLRVEIKQVEKWRCTDMGSESDNYIVIKKSALSDIDKLLSNLLNKQICE